MSTTQVRVERRASQRFDFQLPVCVRVSGSEIEGHGFTQDLSGRGVFFFTDFHLAEGDAIELTLVMPSEITLGESMRVKCRGRVTRVAALGVGGKNSVAAHFEGYEYLPAVDGSLREAGRSSLPEAPREDEAGMSLHTFDWRGTAPLVHH
jgi:PilZ domain